MRLNHDQNCCDPQQLEAYLNTALDDHVATQVETHLTSCHACRECFERAAFSQEEWQRTQSLLRPDDLDIASAELQLTHGQPDEGSRHDEATMLSREIQGWLDPSDDPAMLGRFAGYEVIGIIGHGGMGIVLKGFESSLNRYLAIKILAPRLATNGTARKRFAREARAAAAVLHENVIAIHRVDEWHGLPFLVMPYIGGVSLQKRIDDEGPLSIEATLRIGMQIAAGLSAAHAQGLVHRDIKPANILLDQGVERVTITDFGLARAVDDASMTRTGVIAGTPQYMSPEQAEAKAMDARSDLFSLGSVLYTMATGRPPFRGEGSFEVLKRVSTTPARPLRELDPTIPIWFENLVGLLHEKSAQNRPKSAKEVQRLVNSCLLHITQPNRALPHELVIRATSKGSHWSWTAGGFGILTLALTWVVFFMQPLARVNDDQGGEQQSRSGSSTGDKGKQMATVLGEPIYLSEQALNDPELTIVGHDQVSSASISLDAINRELAGLDVSVHHEFGNDGVPRDRFAVRGEDESEHIAAKPDGLHVSHPGTGGFSSTSVEAQMRVHGNFEVTVSFESLSFNPGEDGSGGVFLTAILENDGHTHCAVQRGALLEPLKPVWHFVQSEFVRSPQREPGVVWLGTTAEDARSGRLRLARVGETIHCLFAASDSPEFRLIHSEQVGPESLLFGGIRLVTGVQSNGHTHGTTSVIWKYLTIRAERITDWPAQNTAQWPLTK